MVRYRFENSINKVNLGVATTQNKFTHEENKEQRTLI